MGESISTREGGKRVGNEGRVHLYIRKHKLMFPELPKFLNVNLTVVNCLPGLSYYISRLSSYVVYFHSFP